MIDVIVGGIAGLLSIPVAVLFLEVVAALSSVMHDRLELPNIKAPKRVAVIVPAHNESVGILPTLLDIKSQIANGDRLIVVADNCSDDTAAIAEAAGAEVIVRNDAMHIGKGYALGWGIKYISADPPNFVIFIDADCRIQSDMLERLTGACQASRRAIQACFLMKAPENSPINHSLAEFAWVLKNWVRPLGLRSLDLPVQLMGTGMIFPWDIIRSAPLSSGNLVEDLKLGLDLAVVGAAPHFYPFVIGTSDFPMSEKGTDTQRERWVKGHVEMILKAAPRLFIRAILDRNIELLALTLDLAVPPLSLLVLMLVGIFGTACLSSLISSSSAPLMVATGNLVVFAFAILLAWLKFGRDILPPRSFFPIGRLLLQRIRLYCQMILGKTASHWIRTDRDKS